MLVVVVVKVPRGLPYRLVWLRDFFSADKQWLNKSYTQLVAFRPNLSSGANQRETRASFRTLVTLCLCTKRACGLRREQKQPSKAVPNTASEQ